MNSKSTKINNKLRLIYLTVISLLLMPFGVFAQTQVDKILARLHNANDHRNHVMIVAHRGLWSKDAKAIYAEGSLASINKAIELGIEAVEFDIRKSSDNVFVSLHDEDLERTTTCKGKVYEKTIAELKKCHLVITTSAGRKTIDEVIPTLEEVFLTIKDKILINLDNKIGYDQFPAMFALAKKVGVQDQILATINQNNEKQRAASAQLVGQFKDSAVNFLPNLYDSHIGLDIVEYSLKTYSPPALQLRNYHKPDGPLTMDGGELFSQKALDLANKYNAHLWINTLYTKRKDAGKRSGGRGDEMAIYANLPSEVYGFWAKQGATMIQTDEPENALIWLERNGYRQPY